MDTIPAVPGVDGADTFDDGFADDEMDDAWFDFLLGTITMHILAHGAAWHA